MKVSKAATTIWVVAAVSRRLHLVLNSEAAAPEDHDTKTLPRPPARWALATSPWY